MGEFRHAIDGKSRLTIPSAWRYEEEAEFFLRPSSDGQCLKVMPLAEVERVRAQAAQLPGPVRLQLLRELGAGTRQCRLDKAGRLVVPEDFCGALKLAGEVVLAGAIESFEIWNPGAWADAKAKVEAVAVQHLASFGL
ncbi:MAG: hypothetical protein RLZZ253_234 [Verrucomicrobiota bacterium]|jgi:MraZ protein